MRPAFLTVLGVLAAILITFLAIHLSFAQTCTLKSQGDADCLNGVNLVDYEIWRREYLGIETTTRANFDGIGTKPDLIDYEIWRRGFLGINNPPPPANPPPANPPPANPPPPAGVLPYTPPQGFPFITSLGTYISTLGVPRSLLPYRTSSTIMWNLPLPANTPTDPNNAGQVADFARKARQGSSSYNQPAYFENDINSPEVYLVDPDRTPFVPIKFRCPTSQWWNYNASEFENYINNAYPGKYGVPIPPEVKLTNTSSNSDSPLAIYDYKNDIQFNFWLFHTEGSTRYACWAGHTGGQYTGIKDPGKCTAGTVPAKFSQGNGTFCWPFGEDTAGFTDLGTNITFDDYYSYDINHAVAISIDHVKEYDFSYPATRYNGLCTYNDFKGASSFDNCIYIGQRLRLPSSYNTAQIQNKATRALAEAVQKYGFIVHDGTAGINIQLESNLNLTQNGKIDAWASFFNAHGGEGAVIQAFPWESLQVLPKDYRW